MLHVGSQQESSKAGWVITKDRMALMLMLMLALALAQVSCWMMELDWLLANVFVTP